jgi:hypothetical protein
MNIREHQLALDVMKKYIQVKEQLKTETTQLLFRFTRAELISIMKWKYAGQALEAHDLEAMTDTELASAVGTESEILEYFIEKWERRIQLTPTLNLEETRSFFTRHEIESHYLNFKPIDEWDAYDQSNFYHLILKHGKAKKVYAIFMADVNDEDLHAVTTQPSYFFDTYQEAEEELAKILEERGFEPDELKIKSLFKIN